MFDLRICLELCGYFCFWSIFMGYENTIFLQVRTMDQKTEKKYPVRSSDYKLYEEVGQGVSATVYRALCIPFNEIVAIKVLDLEKCNSNLDGIRREVQTMSLINHPNVLRAHCSFIADRNLWVVMPYMSGGSCLHIMKSAYPDGFEEHIIATFLREVLKALEYLHSHGHIHRDVKRADIWSFGITALELAHGHAPFSKYPPMKVLLMTLQNAPPGLDYERDKKFSKSFKEMVAMCLVKDPMKRPSAEKLLKHHFFKRARSSDYVAQTVLDGLPPLGDRLRTLKLREMERLAENKMAYGEKEERSQSEYIRGISAWNFDLENLKAQAALIQDDDEIPPAKEHAVNLKAAKESEDFMGVPSYFQSPVSVGSLNMENTEKGGDHVMWVRTGALPLASPLQSANGLKEPFDVADDDINADSPTWKECVKSQHTRLAAIQKQQKDDGKNVKDEMQDLDKEHQLMEEIHHAPILGRKVYSGPLVPEHVLASFRRGSGDGDREKQQRQPQRERNFSGPLISCGTSDIDSCFEPSKSLANMHDSEDKSRGPVVRQKGRFKVTSEDADQKEVQSRATGLPQPPFAPANAASVPTSAILPHLRSILHQNVMQRDQIVNLLNYVSQGGTLPDHHLSTLGSRSSSLSVAENLKFEASSNRERELLQQVAELQCRVEELVNELQRLKMRNAQLERQLNAVFKREEERMNNKETAHDLG